MRLNMMKEIKSSLQKDNVKNRLERYLGSGRVKE